MRKILIMGPAWVGDMVMAQSLFKLLRQQDPSSILHVLAPRWTFTVLSRMPEVAKSIELPIGHGELKLLTRYQVAQQLRQEAYTEAIVLPNSLKAAFIPWLARIPKRTGWLGEFRYFLLNDIRYHKKQYSLMIEQFMALGVPTNTKLPTPYPYPALEVRKTIHSSDRILALGAGAAFGSSKRWLPEYFAEVAKQKLSQGWQVWLFGSMADSPITQQIMRLTHNQCRDFAGKIDLAETIDLLSQTKILITNDSGLMHIGAALNKKIIAIYGSTSPKFTPPLSNDATIIQLNLVCQPCFKRECPLGHHQCMRDILPQQVLHHLEE